MNDNDINSLGITTLQSLCEDLVPTTGIENEELENDEMDTVSEGYVAPLQPEVSAHPVINHEV